MPVEHQEPYHISTFNIGANTEDEKEMLGSKEGSGEYIIGRNQRSVSVEGNTGTSEKIKGEELFYQRNVTGSYTCIGAISVNKNIVEWWASPVGGQTPFVRVNGVVVCQSVLLPITYNNPLQIDRNENEKGGEVFFTDNVVNLPGVVGTPMIFNIKDMVDSLTVTPLKYFSGFDPKLYSINLFIPLDIPVFVETVNVGGGGGLPVGTYSYQLRYSNKDGDRTNISQRTPQIPVVENLSIQSDQYPSVKTYGQDPSPDFGTRYGIKIRFRVTNLQGYDFIEIIRTSYNTNGGINFVPAPKVVAKIDIFSNEISVREFIDPAESNTELVLSDDEITREITFINASKAIRYFDRRVVLMNVELASKQADLEFLTLGGKEVFPVIDKLGTVGFNDPYNFTYRRNYTHGERVGIGVELYDGVGGKGFATKVPSAINYQIPNRREITSAETDLYSYGGLVYTININNETSNTHEVFDHVNAVRKSDKCSFKNIYHNKTASSLLGVKFRSQVVQDCDEDNGEIETHGAHVYGVGVQNALDHVSPYYNPFTPVRQNDSDVSGHNYLVNTQVCKSFATLNQITDVGPVVVQPPVGDRDFYEPRIFAPEYYSQGLALTGVSNFPNWAKSFSVVRTEPARRVIAQGIAMYKMTPAIYQPLGINRKLATKELNQFIFYSSDIERGIVSGRQIDDIIDSPESYQLQFVAPLGFASELYSFESNEFGPPASMARDRSCDIIAYARMQRDRTGAWEINPMENNGMGYDATPPDGYQYVAYGKWRNRGQQPGLFGPDGSGGGNRLFNIQRTTRISEGRGTYMVIEMGDNINLYGSGSTSGSANFDQGQMQDFTEPFYIVNIVADGAKVRDQNIENYRITSHYQKIESIIGESDGTVNQSFLLVDERWEDVIPALSSSHPTAITERYIYIKDPNTGIEQKWLNVTYLSAAQIAVIVTAINTAGFYGSNVTGLFRHEDIDNQHRFFNVIFNVSGFTPANGTRIIIKYDNTAPIRFWGGDSIVGESIFAPIDREASANGENSVPGLNTQAPDKQFAFGIGFPYRLWKVNPRYYQIKRTTGANVIQDRTWGYLGYIRQMCVMFTSESRIALPYAHNNDSPNQFFPLINYVIRPHRWKQETNYFDNNIYPEYQTDYGLEIDAWKYGGFRFIQQINPDYSTLAPKEFVSKPQFGFVEQTRFLTRVMWSLPRQINQQNTPGLKTFPANNSFDIDDNQGEIKRAWDATTSKGENLYSITNTGICLLITKKSILTDLNSNDIAYMAANLFVKQQYWLNKSIGMSDEMWRSAAEDFVPTTLPDGSEVRMETLFFANNESVFRFMENEVKDIGRINYHNTLFQKSLSKIQPGYATKITGVYDKYHEEYWLYVDNGTDTIRTDVFGQKNDKWYGIYDYRFDKFIALNNRTFGFRNVETYELGKGLVINNANIIYELTGASAPKMFIDKEFIRVRINTGDEVKPTSIDFYKKYEGPVVASINSSLGALYVKKYGGYEAFIPRMLASFSPTRNRLQCRMIVFKVTHDAAEDFRVIDFGVMYKEIK